MGSIRWNGLAFLNLAEQELPDRRKGGLLAAPIPPSATPATARNPKHDRCVVADLCRCYQELLGGEE